MHAALCLIYVTTKDVQEAERLAGALLAEKLVACANILPHMISLYRWEGKIERADEAVLLLKTRADLYAAVERRVSDLHSYEVPCIVRYDAAAANPAYAAWVEAETS